ncbi:MAG: ferric iron uptake transcriptional regulator [Magnetococcus sp. WYHC-3]
MDHFQRLKRMGLKATGPRIKVFDLFVNGGGREHWSAEEVYRRLLTDGEEVGLATIYRVLTQFEQAGLLVRHHFEGGKAVYELEQGRHHDHLVCVTCGHVEEFYDPIIEKRQEEIAAERGFHVQEHALYVYGECRRPDCPRRAALEAEMLQPGG